MCLQIFLFYIFLFSITKFIESNNYLFYLHNVLRKFLHLAYTVDLCQPLLVKSNHLGYLGGCSYHTVEMVSLELFPRIKNSSFSFSINNQITKNNEEISKLIDWILFLIIATFSRTVLCSWCTWFTRFLSWIRNSIPVDIWSNLFAIGANSRIWSRFQ